jgi:hypothetical protein
LLGTAKNAAEETGLKPVEENQNNEVEYARYHRHNILTPPRKNANQKAHFKVIP